MKRLFVLSAAAVLTLGGIASAQGLLAEVRSRGHVICGVNNQLPGFGNVEPDGSFSGFDVDFCRAIAAAVLGDANAVDFRPLTAVERPVALQTGEVDVLIRNTTWTANRDTQWGANFIAPNFYDGQGFIVRNDSGITQLADFEGRGICVQPGTTTELNLADTLGALDIQFTPVIFDTADQTFAAYESGLCDSVTTDVSGLVSRRSTLENPADHSILPIVISKEPLGPSVRHGDDEWYDVVKWVVYATFNAEEYGLTQANVEEARESAVNPDVLRLLGVDASIMNDLGLAEDAMYQVILQVGNYGEIYDRNLGPDTPVYIPRGPNEQWYNGGLIYGMPFR